MFSFIVFSLTYNIKRIAPIKGLKTKGTLFLILLLVLA